MNRGSVVKWLAVTLWTVMTIACLSKAYLKPTKNTVFPIYTFAAGEWLAGRDLYVKMPEYDYYRYSPLMAAFFVPWRELSDAWGGVLWRALGMGILSWGLWRWIRDVLSPIGSRNLQVAEGQAFRKGLAAFPSAGQPQPEGCGYEQLRWWIFLLVAPFVLQNLHNGQTNVHLLGCLLLGVADAACGRCWRSALWFALAGFMKPYVLAIAGLIAIVEPRLFMRLAVMLLGGVAITFLFQWPGYVVEQYHDWFFHFFENDRSASAMRDWYRDLQLLFRVYLWPLPPRVYYVGSAFVGLAMAGVVYHLRSLVSSKSQLMTLACALGGCWVTVLGPATESCTYLLLAPMLTGALMHQRGFRRILLIVAYGLFFLTIAAALFPANWKVQVWGPQPIAALIFLAVTAETSFRLFLSSAGDPIPTRLAA